MKKLLCIFLGITLSQNSFSQIRLPKLIADGMVLQRDKTLENLGLDITKGKN